MKTELAVKRITLKEAIEHIGRDGQRAFDYMAADMVIAEIERLRAQRDELAAALRTICDAGNGFASEKMYPTLYRAHEQARAALAKIKADA